MPLGLSSNWNVLSVAAFLPTEPGQATSRGCRDLSGMLRVKTGLERQAGLRCGLSEPPATERGLPEGIWKTPQRARADLIYKSLPPPPAPEPNTDPDILQGMSRHLKSSSLQMLTSGFPLLSAFSTESSQWGGWTWV